MTQTQSPAPQVTELDWPDAQRAVIEGKKITRLEWKSDDCVFLHAGRLHIRTATGLHQLQVSEGDMVATDWIVVREN